MKEIFLQIAAAITFFTRLPLWKVLEIPSGSFKKIICFWPLTGWITAGFTASVWFGLSFLFPPAVAVIIAFAFRILVTGGLHEDGLGDFFDGFGGGRSKEDVLRIMKDSHVGSYALIGIVLYFLLLVNIVVAIPKELAFCTILVADPFSKMLAALMMNVLPYARNEDESKAKTVFEKLHPGRLAALLFFGFIPVILFLDIKLWLAMILPMLVVVYISVLSKKKVGGYTGDICGATALLCELSFYLSVYLVFTQLH